MPSAATLVSNPPPTTSSDPTATLHFDAVDALVASARWLQSATGPGVTALLRGKRLALLSDDEHSADAARFCQAAVRLGADVARVSSGGLAGAAPASIGITARMFGRLYDAVECQGLAPALVDEVRREAGVPVFDGIASDHHPTAAFADQVDGAGSSEAKRQRIVEAVLISVLR